MAPAPYKRLAAIVNRKRSGHTERFYKSVSCNDFNLHHASMSAVGHVCKCMKYVFFSGTLFDRLSLFFRNVLTVI